MSTIKKTFTQEIDSNVLNEFNEVINTISTEEEPFEINEWLEAKMVEFTKQQKESFAWNSYVQRN